MHKILWLQPKLNSCKVLVEAFNMEIKNQRAKKTAPIDQNDKNFLTIKHTFIAEKLSLFKSENKESCIPILNVIFMWGGNPA